MNFMSLYYIYLYNMLISYNNHPIKSTSVCVCVLTNKFYVKDLSFKYHVKNKNV